MRRILTSAFSIFSAWVLLHFSVIPTLVHAQTAAQDAIPSTESSVSAPNASDEDHLNAAVNLLNEGAFDEAIDVLRPHIARDARTLRLLFDTGLTLLEAAERIDPEEEPRALFLSASIKMFRAILVEHPDFVRAQLELGRAFFLNNQDGLARRYFNRALSSDLPTPVANNVNRFLSIMRARKRWNGYFGTALAPDTNIGNASESDIVYVEVLGTRLPFTLDDPPEETSGIGLTVWGGGEYYFPLSPRWRLNLGTDFYRRDYPRRRYDQMGIGVHAGPSWLIDRRTDISFNLTANRNWTERDKPASRSRGAQMELTRRLTPRLRGNFGVVWDKESDANGSDPDEIRRDISTRLSYVLTPTIETNVRLGWGQDRTQSTAFRKQRRSLSIGANIVLPRGFNLGSTVSSYWTDYNWPGDRQFQTVDGSDREDVQRSLRLSLFKRDLTFIGFSPRITLIHQQRSSNVPIADYKRTSAELSFVQQF